MAGTQPLGRSDFGNSLLLSVTSNFCRKFACVWFPGAPGCFSHFCCNLQVTQLGRMWTPSVWCLQRWRELLRTQAASHSCREGSGGGGGTTENRFPCNQIQKLPGEPQSKGPQGASVGSDMVGLIHPSRQIPGVCRPVILGEERRRNFQECHSGSLALSSGQVQQLAPVTLSFSLITLVLG